MNKNALIGIALVVVVVGVVLVVANKPKTQVATVTDTPLTTSEPTTMPVVTNTPVTPVATDSPVATTSPQDSQWKRYSDPRYPISFEYPANTDVTVTGTSDYFSILDNNNTGFSVTVGANSSAPFFNPPANTDVTQWVLHNKAYPTTYDKIGAPQTISGMKAVHLFVKGDQTGPSNDFYYVIKNQRLYEITLIGDSADHNSLEKSHFLDSIQIK